MNEVQNSQNPVLSRLLVSSALVGSSVAIYQFMMPLFLYDITKSASAMANLRALEYMPNVLLAPIVGVFIDRVNKKRAHQGAVIVQICLMTLLVLLMLTGVFEKGVWSIYPIAFVLMTCGYVNDNARMSIVKLHIPTSDLTQANARLVSIWTIIAISIPSVAAFLMGYLDFTKMFMLVVIFLIGAFFSNKGLPQDPPKENYIKTSLGKSLKEGIQILWQNTPLLQLCFMVVLMNAADGIIMANLAFLLKDRFDSNNNIVGFVLSLAGVGAFLGSLFAPRIRQKLGLSKLFKVGFALNAILCLPPIIFAHPVTFGITVFGLGFVGMIQAICIWSFRQESTPAAYIGRVSGLTGAIFKIGMPVGILISGALVSSHASSMVFIIAMTLQIILLVGFYYSKMNCSKIA